MTKAEFLVDISSQLPNDGSINYDGATVNFSSSGVLCIEAGYMEIPEDDEDAEQFLCDQCEDTGELLLCDLSVFPNRYYREPCGYHREEAE